MHTYMHTHIHILAFFGGVAPSGAWSKNKALLNNNWSTLYTSRKMATTNCT